MRIVPRADGDEQPPMTSLIDMAFLLLVFFMALPFKTLDSKLHAHLPRGDGPRFSFHEPKETVKVRIRQVDDRLVYKLGQHEKSSAEELQPLIRALGPTYAFEIDAGPKVPWQGVVDAVNVLAAVDCKDVRFRGGPPRPR